MERVVITVILAAVVAMAAVVLSRRRTTDAPSQPSWSTPAQLDRSDFDRPDAPWLVAVFSSSTCSSCAATVAKARVLESGEVAVQDVEVGRFADLHRRYRIEAVPIVVIADQAGVVRAGFVGPMSATDLWASVAEVRSPGSTPHDHGGQGRPGVA